MFANWELFFQRVLKDERTTFEDDPDDNGGPTKCGITIADVARWYGLKLKTDKKTGRAIRGAGDWDKALPLVKALDPSKAAAIYKKFYWDACRADDLPSGIDYTVVDFSVNSGIGRAIGSTLCPLIGAKPATNTVTDDMIAKIKSYGRLSDLINNYQDARKAYLIAISDVSSKKYAKNAKYRNGWLARVERVRDTALKLAAEAPADAPIVVSQRAPKAMTAPPPPTPSKTQVAAKSKSTWVGLSGLGITIASHFHTVTQAVGDFVSAAFNALPDIVSSSQENVQAFTDLGRTVGAADTIASAATVIGITCVLVQIYRHIEFKHAVIVEQQEEEEGVIA